MYWALFQNRNRKKNRKKNFHNTSDTISIEAYWIGGVKRLWSFMKWPHDELSVFIFSSIRFDVNMRIFIMFFKQSYWIRFYFFDFSVNCRHMIRNESFKYATANRRNWNIERKKNVRVKSIHRKLILFLDISSMRQCTKNILNVNYVCIVLSFQCSLARILLIEIKSKFFSPFPLRDLR